MSDDFCYQPPTSPWLTIVHQDEHLVIVDKPSGLLSVPGRLPCHFDSAALRLQRVYPQALAAHRLDMDTSGLLLFALGAANQKPLGRQFEKRLIGKGYLALVWGQPAAHAHIDLPLRCDWPNRPRQMVDHEQGKSAQTDMQLLATNGEISLVALTPHTGRSHQLRVHMASIGHPIAGDRLYAGERWRAHTRLMLHAADLRLRHPEDGRWCQWHSPLPAAMSDIIAALTPINTTTCVAETVEAKCANS